MKTPLDRFHTRGDLYVSYMDVLGFAQKTEQDDGITQAIWFLSEEIAIGRAVSHCPASGYPFFHQFQISDSIFLISSDPPSLIEASARIYINSLSILHLPLACHIAKGNVCFSPELNIFIGPGINRAVKGQIESSSLSNDGPKSLGAGIFVDENVINDSACPEDRFLSTASRQFRQYKTINYALTSESPMVTARILSKEQWEADFWQSIYQTINDGLLSLKNNSEKFDEKYRTLLAECYDVIELLPDYLRRQVTSLFKK